MTPAIPNILGLLLNSAANPETGGGTMPSPAPMNPPSPQPDPLEAVRQGAINTASQPSVANDVLMGMIKGTQTPEQLSGGTVARNALSNWARGALMGPNFVSAQEEEEKKKQQEFVNKLALAKAKAAEDETKQARTIALLTSLQRDNQAQELNRIRQENAKTALGKLAEQIRNNKVKESAKTVDQDLKKFDLETKSGLEKARTYLAEQQAKGLVHPNALEQARIMAGVEPGKDVLAPDEVEKMYEAMSRLAKIHAEASPAKPAQASFVPMPTMAGPNGEALKFDRHTGEASPIDGVARLPKGEEASRATPAASNVIQINHAYDIVRDMTNDPEAVKQFGRVKGIINSSEDIAKYVSNPKVKELLNTIHSIAKFDSGVHGFRSAESAEKTFKAIVGNLRSGNPADVIAALVPYQRAAMDRLANTDGVEAWLKGRGWSDEQIKNVVGQARAFSHDGTLVTPEIKTQKSANTVQELTTPKTAKKPLGEIFK